MQVEVPRLQSDRRQPTGMGRETMAFVAGEENFSFLSGITGSGHLENFFFSERALNYPDEAIFSRRFRDIFFFIHDLRTNPPLVSRFVQRSNLFEARLRAFNLFRLWDCFTPTHCNDRLIFEIKLEHHSRIKTQSRKEKKRRAMEKERKKTERKRER